MRHCVPNNKDTPSCAAMRLSQKKILRTSNSCGDLTVLRPVRLHQPLFFLANSSEISHYVITNGRARGVGLLLCGYVGKCRIATQPRKWGGLAGRKLRRLRWFLPAIFAEFHHRGLRKRRRWESVSPAGSVRVGSDCHRQTRLPFFKHVSFAQKAREAAQVRLSQTF